ncbi:BAH_G0017740.mRNA.1.CDS.1 [Saccharomyces cerevisiae]|nr:SX2_G0036510.mRNA.1.CDS.1 [Saccharomyces cerevisiae]CAI4465329.1 BAG_1a_G0017830.mRNA.1.CDS.1 [Saccharomyces cerevisiae]CAI4469138.1 BAH_G0017740.mRNA.1.CDS.1 [Saccharomyces cerevisiae]CAI7117434.1 BAG_1a_G0017830.mRNA.1.CDS.1 [Saccharomyces cerevisiae]CAI7117572.1 BAH_G0017740.mRNA.1.CDS.1 [Saccharomyces cerevisiae]
MSELKTGHAGHNPWASVANSGPISILSYCGSSILMTVTNKFVVNLKDFNMNFVMLFVQSLVCTITLIILRILGYAKFRSLNKTDAKNWFPISFLLVLMIYTSSKALQYLAVPIYTIFKNLTIILIAYGEVLFFGGSVTSMELSSFLLMVLSSVVATWGDQQAVAAKAASLAEGAAGAVASFNPGYFWMFTNCITSALFVLIMRKRIKLTNFKDFDTMFYNNVLALPILLLFSFCVEDWSSANLTNNFSNDSLTAMIISGVASVGISYCSGWCVRVTSSTTYSMVGALNKLPIALSGLIFFDAPRNFLSILSIFIGFLSGIIYAVAKQKKQQAQPLRK